MAMKQVAARLPAASTSLALAEAQRTEGRPIDYVVVGAGAIGGTVGARLVRDGHAVLFCDADAEHVAAVNERGLALEGPVEQYTVGFAGGRVVETDGHPVVLGEWLEAPGGADNPRLWPLRHPAGRPGHDR
jgi:choline dehydrogenase-like flavoprotein